MYTPTIRLMPCNLQGARIELSIILLFIKRSIKYLHLEIPNYQRIQVVKASTKILYPAKNL